MRQTAHCLLWLALGQMSQACGAAPALDETAATQRLVASPKDWPARAALARLRVDSGLPGAGIREFLRLHHAGQLAPRDRIQLGDLLLKRAEAGLRHADPTAVEDLSVAEHYGAEGGDVRTEIYALAAVAALRHSSQFKQSRAGQWLRRLNEQAPEDYRGRALSKNATVTELAALVRWLDGAGAKRRAFEAATRYVDQGGRAPLIVKRWLELHQWWYGDSRSPVPSVLARSATAPLNRLLEFSELVVGDEAHALDGATVAPALATDWDAPEWLQSLEAIEAAMRREPAYAERLAQDFVDAVVYGAPRYVIVVELFHQLKAPLLAQRWALKLIDEYPGKPSYLLVAALASAAAGAVGPSEQFTTKAAAASGDPGHYQAIIARRLRLSGELLAAIAAGRLALSLSAPGQDLSALLELYRSQRALGRHEDAATTLVVLQERFPIQQRPAVVALVGMTTDGATSLVDATLRPTAR